jgi:predicted  nucleic acid-binding Zn-ribbon protein
MSEQQDLLVLQQHDTLIDQLRHRRTSLPERTLVTQLTAERGRLGGELGAVQSERDGLGDAQGRLETEVAGLEDKRRTLERRLSATSVPREAQTMSAEIDSLKARQSTLEDEIMELMEAVEPLDARLTAGSATLHDLDERLVVGRAAQAEAETRIDQELRQATAERDEVAHNVPAPLLARYERLRSSLGGVAVATLDAGRCTGCNLLLPTAEVERARRAGADAIVECEQCGRMLVR